MNALHDKLLRESPLVWIGLLLEGRGRFWRNVRRQILWAMLQREEVGTGERVELPAQLSHDEMADVLRDLSRADAIVDLAKARLSDLMTRFPEERRSSSALGLVEQFTEQATADQARVELFSLLLERASLESADRELLERARMSIETRMMEYVLPVLGARKVTDWDLQERAHLAQFGTNPARASAIDEELEALATFRGKIILRALSAGASLAEAEIQERARWE